MKQALLLFSTLVVLLLRPSPALGDELAEIRGRLLEMESENERLRAWVEEQARFIDDLASRVERLTTGEETAGPVGAHERPQETPASEDSSSTPQLFIRGFVDTTAFVQSKKNGLTDGENAFALNE